MKKTIAVVLAAILLLVVTTPALADGGFFAMREYYDVYQPSQKAVIVYEKGREDLILSVKYEGDADEFAWVIPVPNKPKIDVTDPEPPMADNPLMTLDNVFITGHASWYTEEAVVELRQKSVANIVTVLRGEWPPSLANPQVKG